MGEACVGVMYIHCTKKLDYLGYVFVVDSMGLALTILT